MTVFYSDTMNSLRNTTPRVYPDASEVHGRVRCFKSIITLATQTTSDTIEVAILPRNSRFLFGMLITSVSLGTATVAIGITGTTGKYRTAAVFTATDTPTTYGNNGAIGVGPLAADEIHFITIGTASLPASGTLVVLTFYMMD